jgi:tRNA (Thr-GGU) A37 N-methylase
MEVFMKRSIVVLAVALACLLLAPVALAQSRVGCDPGGSTGFHACGTVSSVDVADNLLTLNVTAGSAGLPSPLTVAITPDTQISGETPIAPQASPALGCGDNTVTLDQVAIGEQIRVGGTIDASSGTPVYDALRISVHQPRFSCQGTVSAVDVTDGLLTVDFTNGSDGLVSPLAVTITADTQITADAASVAQPSSALGCADNTITLDQVMVGEQVSVHGTIDASSGTPVYDALRVRVHQPRFFCEGAVSAIDTTNNILTVDVAHGSAGLIGTTALTITPDARLFSFADFACSQLDLSQVAVGDQVAVCGVIDASSGTPVYDARVVFDCGAITLPAPASQPTALSTGAKSVTRGKSLKVHLRISDAMPGSSTASVSVAVVNAKGAKVAAGTVSGVALNKAVTLSVKLRKSLIRGTYRVVTKATDDAGNRQLRAGSAVLRVR